MSVSYVYVIGILASLTLMTDCLSLEEKVQHLEERNAILTAKIDRLERLESKFQQLETILIGLQNEHQVSSIQSFTSIQNHLANEAITKNNAIYRTCRELRQSDSSLTSGMYLIDPDGQAIGDDPINVYCDMTTGKTSILHDSENVTNVGHCADPGCYSRKINYSASMRQMSALASISNECHQSIRYDCNYAPFEINGVTYAWWNDKNGDAQYFWAGSDNSIHTCQCGIDKNCVESFMFCNCDSGVPVNLTDDGVIANKDYLPITQLNFGRTQLETSLGAHTLGRFECSGQAVAGMPKSCDDLWLIGHTLSGLFSIAGETSVETVYCDFTKIPNEQGFQTWIGNVDVKSKPTYFYVQRNESWSTQGVPIIFNVEKVNIGNAMDTSTGIFTASRKGTYFFAFSGLGSFPFNGSSKLLYVHLLQNGNNVGFSYVLTNENDVYDSLSLQATLQLEAGDRVWLEMEVRTRDASLYDSGSHYNHFVGWLLEEDMSSSFSKML